MLIMKHKKTISCLIVMTLIMQLLIIGFPGNASASEDSTSNSEEILGAQQLTLDSNAPATNKDIITPPIPEIDKDKSSPDIVFLPSPKKEDGESSNDGIFVKRVSNMPKVDETPQQFTPVVNNKPTTTDTTALENVHNKKNELTDTRIIDKQNDDEYPIKNKDGYYKVGFASQSGQNLLQFEQGYTSISMSPLAANQVTGMTNKNTIYYGDIFTDTDLRYTADDYSIKEEIIVNKPTGQSDFLFNFAINNATPKVDANGIINFYEKGNSIPSFYIPKPFAVDNNGERCDQVSLELYKEGILKLSVDPNWLKKAAYPVTIDPTINLTGSEGTGYKRFWNYTQTGLGGGWGFSVNTFNTNLLLSKTLFQIPGRGIPIGESITYNSQDNTVGPLGLGWHLGNDISLTEKSDNSVIYIAGDGGVYLFTPNDSGGYNAPPGVYLTLAKDASGIFTITDKAQTVTTFAYQTGKPTQIVDRNNNTTTFSYDSNERLYTLSDPSGRKITYSYYTSGQLRSVADAVYNTYTFDYQGNSLVTVTDPDNESFDFHYDANDYLDTFTDPLNKVTKFSINSSVQLQYFDDARSVVQDVYRTSFSLSTPNNSVSPQIAPGSLAFHTLALKSDGTVWAWGANNSGQLGNGTTTNSSVPVQVNNLANIIAVAAGGAHSLALKADGTVWAWGNNYYGQIGDGTFANRNTPVQVKKVDGTYLTGIIAIAAGNVHSLVLKSDGSVWAWGHNGYYQLGDGTQISSIVAKQVNGVTNAVAVSAGFEFSLALLQNGNVLGWGKNNHYEIQGAPIPQPTPTTLSGVSNVKAISAGPDFTMVLKNDGSVWTAGNNSYGQLGHGNYGFDEGFAQILTGVAQISAAQGDGYAIKSDGTVWGWGGNGNGELGLGNNNMKTSPVILPLSNVQSIAAAYGKVHALNPDGSISAAGSNNYGQLGDGTTVDKNTPVLVKAGNDPFFLTQSVILTVTDPGGHTFTFTSDPTAGNLMKYSDPLGDTWKYTWNNNNQTSSQDAKGTTTYQYDNQGNVTSKTTTVDSNTVNNITQTMTYDNYNQLTQLIDGSGRITKYQYDNKGNLLSTNNANIKESNGKLFDQYGNVIQSSPAVSASQNLLKNGSFETGGQGGSGSLANWSHYTGNATVSSEGFDSHGNYALKMSSSTTTTDLYCQQINGILGGEKLTLRADIKLDGVAGPPYGGAMIKIDYQNGYYDAYNAWGSGTFPLVVTSQAASNNVVVYIGLNTTSGTAWFDGVQLENTHYSNDGYNLSAFNSVENGGFENSLNSWNYASGTPVTVTNEAAWEGTNSAKLTFSSTATGYVYQDVPVYSGEPLTFSGNVKTNNVTGNGANFKIEYFNSTGQSLSPVPIQTGYVTGTQDFTRLSSLAIAPSGAYYARVSAVLDGSGTAYFDNVKIIPRNSQQYTYDDAGNYVLVSEDALGIQNSQTYDTVGNVQTYTDALNYTTTYYYDSLNRLVQVTDPSAPSGHNAYYGYDSDSNLTASRDPRSSSGTDNTYLTVFSPNNLNQLGTLTDPLNRSTIDNYDRSGNLTNVSLPNGLAISYAYDNANRLTQKTLDGGKYFIYTYDGANNLVNVKDQNNNNYPWSYDGANRITGSTDPSGFTQTYQWDKSNNLTSETGNWSGTVNYYYGSDSRFLGLTLPNGNTIAYNYDENGRLFGIRYPGNSSYKKNVSYQANGRVDTIQDTAFPGHYHNQYYYDDNGNISNISSWAGYDSFTYDSLGRLNTWNFTPLNGTPIQESYTYDDAGNLLTKGSKTFTYNSANQITVTGFTYDLNGNLTSDGIYQYSYDAENKITQVNRVSDNSLVATYTYYFNGLRKSKTVNGVTTNFIWDAFGRLVREYGSDVINYYYDSNGQIVGLNKNGATYIYHTNLRGDVVSVTDYSGGTLYAQYNYDPWGNQISYSGTLSQHITYAGYYYDAETGLYYLKNRYYSPQQGRFLTKDAYGNDIIFKNPQTLNLYTYAGNNPMSNVDPDGNWFGSAAMHAAVQAYVIKHLNSYEGGGAAPEVPIPGSSLLGGTGRADVVQNFDNTNFVWEIKPDSTYGHLTGPSQLDRYVDKIDDGDYGYNLGPLTVPYGDTTLQVHMGEPGVLYYSPAPKKHSNIDTITSAAALLVGLLNILKQLPLVCPI
ncbi:MAG: RCC1 domain-containing protein [Bacillota bacterium]